MAPLLVSTSTPTRCLFLVFDFSLHFPIHLSTRTVSQSIILFLFLSPSLLSPSPPFSLLPSSPTPPPIQTKSIDDKPLTHSLTQSINKVHTKKLQDQTPQYKIRKRPLMTMCEFLRVRWVGLHTKGGGEDELTDCGAEAG